MALMDIVGGLFGGDANQPRFGGGTPLDPATEGMIKSLETSAKKNREQRAQEALAGAEQAGQPIASGVEENLSRTGAQLGGEQINQAQYKALGERAKGKYGADISRMSKQELLRQDIQRGKDLGDLASVKKAQYDLANDLDNRKANAEYQRKAARQQLIGNILGTGGKAAGMMVGVMSGNPAAISGAASASSGSQASYGTARGPANQQRMQA